jgi:hydrogenase maturation protease
VIIVDAAMMGLPAGTVRRFTWEDVRVVQQNTPFSLHQSDLTETLLLAEVLNCLPQNTVIFGVQPQHTDWDQPVSEAVLEAIPTVVEALLREIRS